MFTDGDILRLEGLTACPKCHKIIDMKNPDQLTTKEAAEILGCDTKTIWRMIQRGTLNAWKLDPSVRSVYRVSRAQVLELVSKPGEQPAAARRKRRS